MVRGRACRVWFFVLPGGTVLREKQLGKLCQGCMPAVFEQTSCQLKQLSLLLSGDLKKIAEHGLCGFPFLLRNLMECICAGCFKRVKNGVCNGIAKTIIHPVNP